MSYYKHIREACKKSLLDNRNDIELKFQEKTVLGETKILTKDKFDSGTYNGSFILYGWDKHVKDWKKSYMESLITFHCCCPIYYGNTLVAREFSELPYYLQAHSWTKSNVNNQKIDIVLDFRIAGVYGRDYDCNLLNQHEIDITPVYRVPRDVKKYLYDNGKR